MSYSTDRPSTSQHKINMTSANSNTTTTTTTTTKEPQTNDRYYGQKDLAEFCEHVIINLFDISFHPHNLPSTKTGLMTPPPSPGLGPKKAPVLVEFIAYALYRTRLPNSIVYQSLLLLDRLKSRYPSARGTTTSPHRLFLASLMLSSKISMDDTYSNKSWAIVGGNFFALKEVNQMERELFAFLGWNAFVTKEQLEEFINKCRMKQQVQTSQSMATLTISPSTFSSTTTDRKRRRSSSTNRAFSQSTSAAVSFIHQPIPPSPPLSPQSAYCKSYEDMERHRSARDAAHALLNTKQPQPSSSYLTPKYRLSSNSSKCPSTTHSSTASSSPNSPLTPANGPINFIGNKKEGPFIYGNSTTISIPTTVY